MTFYIWVFIIENKEKGEQKMKKEKLVLIDKRRVNGSVKGFKIKKAVNTIDYRVGDYMSEADVSALLNLPYLTVDLVEK